MSSTPTSDAPALRIAVLASGTGSNFRSICAAIDAGECRAEVVALISDKPGAKALSFADARGVPTRVVPLERGYTNEQRAEWNERLAEAVVSFEPELVVLAGFMRILAPPLLRAFPGRIINVHPALLPAFKGHNGVEQALEAGVRITGCSVHVVDDGVDTGPVLAQGAVHVLPDDTVTSLHARIQKVEHSLFPQVIDWISTGRLSLDEPRRAEGAMTGPPLIAPLFAT